MRDSYKESVGTLDSRAKGATTRDRVDRNAKVPIWYDGAEPTEQLVLCIRARILLLDGEPVQSIPHERSYMAKLGDTCNCEWNNDVNKHQTVFCAPYPVFQRNNYLPWHFHHPVHHYD